MSRMRAVTAEVFRDTLDALEWKELDPQTRIPTGRIATDLSDAELLRMASRTQRWRWARQAMYLAEVIKKSRQQRRARQTHPGKRGRA
jgi:hypothetical protein